MKEKREIISTERRTGDLADMANLLGPLARKMLGKKAFAEADVLCNWRQIVGEETAAFSSPLKIEFKKGARTEGVLVVETAGGAFALELQLKSRRLIEKVNTFFGYEAVSGLKIVQNPAVGNKLQQGIHNPQKKLVTREEENYISDLSKDIKYPELNEALQRLGRAVIANNKSDEKDEI